MTTIEDIIRDVKPGEVKAIPLSEVNSVSGYRTAASRINKDLREKGIVVPSQKRKENVYTISTNEVTKMLYIANNM